MGSTPTISSTCPCWWRSPAHAGRPGLGLLHLKIRVRFSVGAPSLPLLPYMILRNGQRTSSPLLDRLVYFDERSRGYPIRTTVSGVKQRGYTWRLDIPVLDQGEEGACVGFGVSHELAARPVVVAGLTNQYARELYWDAQRNDWWEGGAYEGAVPFYEGTSVLAGVQAAQRRGHYSEYRWAFGLDDLILAVGYKGPAILGLNWYSGMFRVDPAGYIRPTGMLLGGHCILCVGVSVTRREFLLANSWGPEWSAIMWGSSVYEGYCKVTFEDMARLLEEDGEAVIPMRVRL